MPRNAAAHDGHGDRISIAVIVVTRNCLAALDITIESVRCLDDPRVKLIFIDGASTDGTAERVEQMRGRAHYAVSEPDRGIYDAMNKGWAAAPLQSYVLYLGAGDRILELPPAADLLDQTGQPLPLLLGECAIGSTVFRSRWGMEMRLRNTAHHQAMLVRKVLHPAPPFDTGLRVYGDWDFNLRLREQGASARHVRRFRTTAAVGGVSWRHDLKEIRLVATRHGGRVLGSASFALNAVSLWKRDWAERHAARQ